MTALDRPTVIGATSAAADGWGHVEVPVDYDAVLLAGFGGPEGQDDVIPFLQGVARGRGIPAERLEVVVQHYRAFGGVSPINGHNRRLRAALAAELAARGMDLPVYWGNRNWAPYLADAVREAHAAGHDTLLAVATSAYSSYSSCRQYREDVARVLDETGLVGTVCIDKVRPYFDHPGFVESFVTGVADGLAELARRGLDPATQVRVLFCTHSVPVADAARSGPAELGLGPGGAYEAQHRAVAQVVMDRAGRGVPWALVFQSRSGPPSQPWLEPDVNDALRGLADEGVRGVLLVPVGFLCDHMEVRWDLDIEALATAARVGLVALRTPTPGASAAFVAGLADLVEERLRGTPVTQRPALTALGPWYDVCRPGCCENARLGFRPAAAGLTP